MRLSLILGTGTIQMSMPSWACTFLKSKCEISLWLCTDTVPPPSSPPRLSCLNSPGNGRSIRHVSPSRASLSSPSSFNDPILKSDFGFKSKLGEPVYSPPHVQFRSVKSPIKKDKPEADYGVSMKTVLESIEPKKDPSSIKILSYNVWFREDLEMRERMEEIGDLIHLHSPDIICLQEVTPDIYDIFQNSSWWRIYQCSVSRQMAYSKAYCCLLLAKLPVKSFSHEPFSNSKMGRELCIAEVKVKPDKSLVVATSHLESPCPGPPKWDQMYSKERVAQAKKSINHLKEHPNVVFGGDMNWDDKLDGHFPYPEGWVDAWLSLRPAEKGYTYDTKSNKMLSGNSYLRKRLDRFICNLQDFKISGIEMVGTEEIPGVSYYKMKKGKNGVEKLMLPVLPSDHFGLLLTVTQTC